MEKVDYSQERYNEVKALILPFLLSKGFKKNDIFFVPISAFNDENVTQKATDSRLTSWYNPQKSLCLLEILDQLRLPQRTFNRPLRVSVTDYTPKTQGPLIGDCVFAKIEQGVLIEKKELLLMPHNIMVTVKGIQRQDEDVPFALGGSIIDVGLRLPADFDATTIRRGNVLCDPVYPIKYVQTLIAKIVIYDLGSRGALCRGEPVIVHSYSSRGPAKLQKFIAVIDQRTGEVIKKSPKFLRSSMFAIVQIKLSERACLELYSNMKNIGRIVIRKDHDSVAAGTI